MKQAIVAGAGRTLVKRMSIAVHNTVTYPDYLASVL
jgi:hypothetical protein